jgi:nucleoid-associated protein YgaU
MPLTSKRPFAIVPEHMYAAGYATRANRSTRPDQPWRHIGRWLGVIVLLLGACLGLARVAVGDVQAEATVVVEPGDTLWSIASSRYPGDDVRARVEEIERLNGLQGPLIEVGETLRMPA